MPCLDYAQSFVCNPAAFNAVRFWIESRTTLLDDRNGTSTEFYQCASCKSENTFAPRDLFMADNYDFMPIFGGDDLLIFRRHVYVGDGYRSLTKAEQVWGKPTLKLRRPKDAVALEAWEQIRDATAVGTPIVGRTEIADPGTGLRAVIEFPVKTMNVSLERRMYQVDTGPIALPDLSRRHEPAIDCLRLAFVAFNAPNFADFVVEQPTAVIEGGQQECQTYHYSGPFSLPAKNTLLALA